MNRGEEDYDQGRIAFQLCAIDSRRRFPTIRSETYAFINTYEMTDGRLKLDCGLIHKIVEGFFAKRLKEEPNHGTSALFIIRYRLQIFIILFLNLVKSERCELLTKLRRLIF
jgi:hypothetical protein